MPSETSNTLTHRKQAKPEMNGQPLLPVSTGLEDRLKEKMDRENLVLWRRPITTLQYFACESGILTMSNLRKLWRNRFLVLLTVLLAAVIVLLYNSKGPHEKYIHEFQIQFVWCAYWVGLGVLSSIGLGTGLHTFLLYLGPHIASVTIAAYECGSLNFPSPPYPDQIICPDEEEVGTKVITIWSIMSKVRVESFMWGAGTALGELPPYFMARAARLSGYDPDDDDDLREFEELQRLRAKPEDLSFVDRTKLTIERLVEKVGFLGILLCASIPNPLFDLAGITCGHFLVPFWTFFGATLIGKAIIKMHIQKLFVIIAFNETLVDKAVNMIRYIPYIGGYLHAPFKELLVKQKAKLHSRTGSSVEQGGSWLAWVFEKLVVAMVVYFLLSIVNSMAQSYHKRLSKQNSAEHVSKQSVD